MSDKTEVVEAEKVEGVKDAPTPRQPSVRRISFADVKRSKTSPEKRGVMKVSAEEIDLNWEEIGMEEGDTIALIYRPMKPGEDSEIRDLVEGFDAKVWTDEYFKEIIIHCLEEPSVPDSAEGRKWLDRWLPGTRSYLARAIQNQSGMGIHIITNAKDELGKLQALPRNTSSN